MSLGKLVIDLAANTARFETDMGRAARIAERKSQRMQRDLKRVGKQLSAIGGIAATAFGALVVEQVRAADELGKLSQRLGASVEALSQYQHVAELAGVSVNTLTMGWQRMTRRIAEAAQGTGEARGALQELGLSAQQLAQLRPEEQFEAIARAMEGVTSEGDRVRLAMRLFDSEGVALLQTMADGADGLRRMREEADRLGLTISGKTAAQAAELNDQMTRLNAVWSGIAISAVNDLMPALRQLTDQFGRGRADIADYADDALTLGKTLRVLASAGLIAKNGLEILGKAIAGVAAFISTTASGVLDAFAQQLQHVGGAVKSLFAGEFADAAASAKAAANIRAMFGRMAAGFRQGLVALNASMEDAGTDVQDVIAGWDAIWSQAADTATDAGQRVRTTLTPALVELNETVASQDAATGRDDLLGWLNRLTDSLDPAAAAMRAYTETQMQLDEAVARGLITQQDADALLQQWADSALRADQAVLQLAYTMQRALADDFAWFWDDFIRTGEASWGRLLDSWRATGLRGLEQSLFGDGGLTGFLFGQPGRNGQPGTAGLLGSGGEPSPLAGSLMAGAGIGGSVSGTTEGQVYGAALAAIGAAIAGPIGQVVGGIVGGLLGGGNANKLLFGSYGQDYGPGTSYTSALGGFSLDIRGSEAALEGRRTEIVNAFRELDRAIALALSPEQIDAATEALADFHTVMKNGEIDIEALRVERWQTAIRAADDQFGEFLATFTDVGDGLAAMRALYDLQAFVDDIEALTAGIGDAAGALAFELHNIQQAIADGQDALESALRVGDPEAIRQAQEQLQQAVMRRYQYEMQQIEQITNALRQLEASAVNFTVGLEDRLRALGGGLNDSGKFGVANALAANRGIAALRNRALGLQQAVLDSTDTRRALADLDQFVQTVDAWLRRTRDQVNAWLTEQLAGITSRRAELDSEAAAIMAAAEQRAQAAQAAAQAASQAAQAARQREIQALQQQLQLAQQWVAVLDQAEQMLADLSYGSANPQAASVRYGLIAADVGRAWADFQAGGDADGLLQLLGTQLQAAQGLYDRPSAEYQAIYNEVMGRIAAVRDRAREEADKALALQEELNALQSATVQAVQAGTATQIALTAEERQRLEEIEAERQALAKEEQRLREEANAMLASIDQEALAYYQWAQNEGERLYAQRHSELMGQLTQITGGMEVNEYIAMIQTETRDYLRSIATDIAAFLDSVRNGAIQPPAPVDVVGGLDVGGTGGNGQGGVAVNIRVDGTVDVQQAVLDIIPTIRRELEAA